MFRAVALLTLYWLYAGWRWLQHFLCALRSGRVRGTRFAAALPNMGACDRDTRLLHLAVLCVLLARTDLARVLTCV